MAKNKIVKTKPVDSVEKEMRAVNHKDFETIRIRTDFLQAAYEGGVAYKNAVDQYNMPVLIEHENELGGKDQQLAMQSLLSGNVDADVLTKYGRRRRTAVYENHCKPIIDKINGYTIRAAPSRQVVEDEIRKYLIDESLKELLEESLKVDRYWLGIDAPAANPIEDEDGEKKEVVNKVDEKEAGLGDPYLRMVDPRRVVDWEYDSNEELVRIVIHEPEMTKGSFLSSEEVVNYYTEWTKEDWTRYKEVTTGKSLQLEVDGTGKNMFERAGVDGGKESFVPFYEFNPPFPTEDLAEMNRALFNIMSLLDEELSHNTFTQKVITGETVENVAKTAAGVGNVMVLPDPDSKLYTVGAIDGQAQSLGDRVNQLRDAMYWIANLEGTGQKNVAESGDKKKRDMETLYTMLTAIIEELEDAENWVLWSLNLIESKDADKATKYPRKFDVSSVADVLLELTEMMKLPFIPAEMKRRKVKELINHLNPLEDNKELEDEVDALPDISENVIKGLESLHLMDRLTPELVIRIMGMPDDLKKMVEDQDAIAQQHKIDEEAQALSERMQTMEINAKDSDIRASDSNLKENPFEKNQPGNKKKVSKKKTSKKANVFP